MGWRWVGGDKYACGTAHVWQSARAAARTALAQDIIGACEGVVKRHGLRENVEELVVRDDNQRVDARLVGWV